MGQILTLTLNPSLDLFTSSQKVKADEKVRCAQLRKDPGGGGINASRVIQRLGGNTLAIFPCGQHAGKELVELLTAENLNIIPVSAQFEVRTSFTVYEESTQRLFRFVPEGSKLLTKDLDSILTYTKQNLKPSDFLLLSGSFPQSVVVEFLSRLKHMVHEAQAVLVVDTSNDSLIASVKMGVDILRINDKEVMFLKENFFGLPDISDEDLAKKLLDLGSAKIFICTRGSEGAFWFERDLTITASPPSVPVVSSVGAGDSFMGGLLYALVEGKSQSEALSLAVACAAATVQSPGTELLQREEVYKILKKVKVTYKPGA
jgi:6-phosphofructokinase 2